ncbi:hypothetical protein DERP_011009 [Dermatophagoides pteronyssinus]|uniref:Uncharacterized protein n=1 Tax=Dermatophagoides pteronyssinus TaxID=6956 RepID=A0ABQ8JUZ7_DERPT|nr:hypothetical protein DERP_011009 [Dermatophagoides pteronyssinus]
MYMTFLSSSSGIIEWTFHILFWIVIRNRAQKKSESGNGDSSQIMTAKIIIPRKNKKRIKRKLITFLRNALRRKNALHDIQVNTLKLIPI